MNRLKKIAMNMVLVAGMALMLGSTGVAQQETDPDQFLGAGEMTTAQPMANAQQNAQQKDKDRLASSHRQSKNRKHKQVAGDSKSNASDKQPVVMARK